MDFTAIRQNIEKHIDLSEEEFSYFTSLLKRRIAPKKKLLLQAGQSCTTFSFVNSGVLRAYYLDDSGKESTVMFALKDWWITDMYCFVNGLPAMLNIETLADSEVLQISKADLDALVDKIPKFERFLRILMQNAYTREQLRVIDSLSRTAEDRYHIFIKKYPQVVQLVTQRQIASYLGITPEFLSTIRAKKANS